jgi:hypothetical protein
MTHRLLTNLLNDRNELAAALTDSPEDQATLAAKDAELGEGVRSYLVHTLAKEIRDRRAAIRTAWENKIHAALPAGMSSLPPDAWAAADAELKAVGGKPEMQTLDEISAAANPDDGDSYESPVAWAEAQLAAGTIVANLTVK